MEPRELLQAVRRRQGLTQAELAWRAGTSAAGGVGLRARPPRPDVHDAPPADRGGRRAVAAVRVARGLGSPAGRRDDRERARRLLDVLSLVEAIPVRRRRATLLDGPGSCRRDHPHPRRAGRRVGRGPSGGAARVRGALALAYYGEPRATIDIDVNVFVPAPASSRWPVPSARSASTSTRWARPTWWSGMARSG